MSRILSILVSILLLACILAGQTATEPKKPIDPATLRELAVEFLRETSLDVSQMRSIENRISFNAELSSLMWFHDQKVARSMYTATIADFRELLLQLDMRMNTAELPPDDDLAPSFLFGAGASPTQRKFRIAMAVRQQIAMSLAEHDGELALNFFLDSAGLISNAQFRKEIEQADKYFEAQLIRQIADSNAAAATKLGTASLKDGIDGNHLELLKKIYKKDAEKGIEFGAAILSRIKADKKAVKGNHVFAGLLSYGAENLEASQKPAAKKAIYTRNDLRDIADQFGAVLLDRSADDEEMWDSPIMYVDQIEKFAPGRGVQIRAKFGNARTKSMTISTAANAVTNVSIAAGTAANSAANANTAMARAAEEREAREKTEKQTMDDIKSLGKPLSKEEREKLVAKIRKSIAALRTKDKKIAALNLLAAQLAKAGDKELADEIMRDARRLINPVPKNYQDFLYSWMVSSGYAEVNPDKAFPMLTDTIFRANETIAAFVKVAEFIDVNEEIIDDGEIQVGMFGGSMIRGITKELGIANVTLMSLAKSDFVKTKALTNSFDRIETRVLAKMLVLRAVLDERKSEPSPEEGLTRDDSAPPPPMPKKPSAR
jgi:hypothetical protein